MIVTPKRFQIFVAVVFSLGFLYYLSWQVQAFSKAPDLEILSVDVVNDKAIIRGQTSKQSRVFINGQEILVKDNGFFTQEVTLSAGENVLSFKAISRIGKNTNVRKIINRDHYR